MTDQPQTTTNTQAEPVLCKSGCGFFGNAATGGCCSKCWRDIQKTKSAVAAAVVAPPSPAASDAGASSSSEETIAEKVVVAPLSLDLAIDEVSMADAHVETTSTPKSSTTENLETPAALINAENVVDAPPVANAPGKKKKKKKASYKNMMASMMKESLIRDDEKEKDDAIRKVTGGGAFSKIEKI